MASRTRKKRKVANNGLTNPASPKKKANQKVSPLQLVNSAYSLNPAGRTDLNGSGSSHSGGFPAEPSPVSPIVMGFDAASALQDPTKAPTVRKSLSLMEQQKALIEARKQQGLNNGSSSTLTQRAPPSQPQPQSASSQAHHYSFRNRDDEETWVQLLIPKSWFELQVEARMQFLYPWQTEGEKRHASWPYKRLLNLSRMAWKEVAVEPLLQSNLHLFVALAISKLSNKLVWINWQL